MPDVIFFETKSYNALLLQNRCTLLQTNLISYQNINSIIANKQPSTLTNVLFLFFNKLHPENCDSRVSLSTTSTLKNESPPLRKQLAIGLALPSQLR